MSASDSFQIDDFFAGRKSYGDNQFRVLSNVESTGESSLVFAESTFYLETALANSCVSVILLTEDLLQQCAAQIKQTDKSFVVLKSPKYEFWKLHNLLVEKQLIGIKPEGHLGSNCRIHPSAVISDLAWVNDGVSIGAGVVVEGGCVIGEGSEIAPGVVIGAEGLQSVKGDDGRIFIRHAGGVRIGKHVRILANSVVSKAVDATYTEINDDTNISILCSVGHNSYIGTNCDIAGNTLIGGSVIVGDNVWIGPSATIKDRIRIGANADVKMGSVVVKDIPENAVVSGNFAYDHRRHGRNHAENLRK